MELQPLGKLFFYGVLIVSRVGIVTACGGGAATAGGAAAAAGGDLGHIDCVLALGGDSGGVEQLGKRWLTLGTNADADTDAAHQVGGVVGGEVGDGAVELLGSGDGDVAALELDVGVDAQGGASSRLERDGVAHAHQVGRGLADVFNYCQCDLLWYERVQLVHFPRDVLVGGVLDNLLHCDRLGLGADILVAVVELYFVRYWHMAIVLCVISL